MRRWMVEDQVEKAAKPVTETEFFSRWPEDSFRSACRNKTRYFKPKHDLLQKET